MDSETEQNLVGSIIEDLQVSIGCIAAKLTQKQEAEVDLVSELMDVLSGHLVKAKLVSRFVDRFN